VSAAQAGLFFKIVRNAEKEDERQFDEEFEVFKTLYIKHRESKRKEQLEIGDAEFTNEQNDEEEDDDEGGEVEVYDVEGGYNK
jgi:hypothetical protein